MSTVHWQAAAGEIFMYLLIFKPETLLLSPHPHKTLSKDQHSTCTRYGLLPSLTLLPSSKPQLHNRHLTPTFPHLMDPQPTLLNNRLQLIRRSLDPVDDTHHEEIQLVAVADADAVVGGQGRRGRRDHRIWARQRGDHELIADENSRRLGGHGRGKVAEDLNTAFVGPIVTEERN